MDIRRIVRIAIVAMAAVSLCRGVWAAVTATPDELQQNSQWVQQNLLGGNPPFSFVYNGTSSSDLLTGWAKTSTTTQLDRGRTQRNITWTDPSTHFEVRCTSIEYADYPVVEWTTYLRNAGTTDTPLLQNIQAIDTRWNRTNGGEFTLRGIEGDSCSANSYRPYEQVLTANAAKSFAADGGRPTNGAFPYYNLSMPGGGVTLAVGWPGQWAANFSRDAGNGIQVTAGQALTNLSLKPGEEIRTPMVAMCSWKGSDTVRAQNLWRRWMLDTSLPGAAGQPMQPITTQCTTGFYPGLKSAAADEIAYAKKYVSADAKPDYWWIDAGWYPCSDWSQTGTWTPDSDRYPNGIKEVSDYVHANGMKLVTWFEPERVREGTWLMNTHPEWLLGSGNTRLLNLGNPQARSWLTNHIDGLITSEGIDLYRQDFNIDPLSYWQGADAANRKGATEIAYIQGYLAFWDELRRRHPDLAIDSCASGGRRNDLETLRRSVPLLRSDYQYAPPYATTATAAGMQCQTYGLASWIPYWGTGVISTDPYMVRSHTSPSLAISVSQQCLGMADSPEWDECRRLTEQQRLVAPYLLGDYYPLTPYSQAEDVWMAWQFDRSELGGGVIQAFRRAESLESSRLLQLCGLDPSVLYELTNLDTEDSVRMLGSELMQRGFLCEIGMTSGSAVLTYHAVPEPSAIVLIIIAAAGLFGYGRRNRRNPADATLLFGQHKGIRR